MTKADLTRKYKDSLEEILTLREAITTETAALQDQVNSLKAKVDWFQRQIFGEKSEKRTNLDPSIQADFIASLNLPIPEVSMPEASEVSSHKRQKKHRGDAVNDTGLRFDSSVPVVVIKLPCAELEGSNADDYEVVSEKTSHRLAQRAASYVILQYVRKVVKHKKASKLMTTPAANNVLDKCVADVSFIAGMLVDKFTYHLPLYRQHQRLKQGGITLSRGTLTNISTRSISLLAPIVDAQHKHCLQSRVLGMDETPIKAGRKSKGKMRQAYFWPIYGEDDEIVFAYAPTRAASNVARIIGSDFKGVLLTDGYTAYAQFSAAREGCTSAGCWAHNRRGFEKADDAEPESSAEALIIIGELYKQEDIIRDKELSGEAKLAHRQEHSAPIVAAFWQWCDAQCHRNDLLPRSPLTRALKYAMARRKEFEVFLSDPDVQIDTNHVERGLRQIPMGRKNWNFCWTELGAEQVGIIQSLLVTCKLHDIDPYVYLADVLQRISVHPASKVIELTPRVWKTKFADDPIRSDLES